MSINSSGLTETRSKRSRIKVLHLITSLEVGGAQHGMLLGLPRLNNDHYEHIVCSIMDRMPMASQFRALGIKVYSLGLNRKIDIGVAFRLRALLNELCPDILHTYLLHGNVLGRIIGRLTGVPVIIGSERTIGQAGFWGRLATRLTNPLTDAVEVNSVIGARVIVQDLEVPAKKVKIVKSGLDLADLNILPQRDAIRSELNVDGNQHLIVYMGRLRPVKGVEFGLRAFASAHKCHSNIRLAIAGEGDQRGYLELLAKELRITEFVSFLGVRKDVYQLLSAADSVLLPSLNEGFPRTAIEAMAAAKPLVATSVGGTPEAVIDEVTGLLVPPADSDALSDAIIRLVGDVDLQKRLGNAGRQRVEQNYSVEQYVARLDEMYREYFDVNVTTLPTSITQDS